jgi:outer membrane protein OmpA-like peptidoglycan-associated protein
MTETTRRTALTACLALGIADLFALNAVVLPNLRRQARAAANAPSASQHPLARIDVEVAPHPADPPPASERVEQPAEPVVVFFSTNGYQLNRQARAILDHMAPQLAEGPQTVMVDGHADARGRELYNDRLSRQRALVVAKRLRQGGVPRSGLVVRVFGASRPAASGTDPRALQRNRRVEIAVRREGP